MSVSIERFIEKINNLKRMRDDLELQVETLEKRNYPFIACCEKRYIRKGEKKEAGERNGSLICKRVDIKHVDVIPYLLEVSKKKLEEVEIELLKYKDL